jgi:AraC family transcriptional regulator
VRDHIESHLDGNLSLVELAGVVGLSARHFASAFRKSVGATPHQHVLHRRIDEAKSLLAVHRRPIAEVAATLGFSSQSHFTEVFHRRVGSTPMRFRQEH